MKGFLLLIIGLVLGALLVIAMQLFLLEPTPLPQSSPSQSDMVILFTNEYMTRMLQTYAAQASPQVPLQGVTVRGNGSDQLILAGNVNATVRGVTITRPVQITLHPTVQGNSVQIQIVKAEAGGLTIPGNYFQGLEGPINQQINQTLQSTPYQIVGVSTTIEGLVVNVVVKK